MTDVTHSNTCRAVGIVSVVFLVVSAFGCGGKKDVHVASTDDSGVARFTDNQTGEDVVITVVGGPRRQALAGADVSFLDGEGYEAFLATDPSAAHLPRFEVFPHNSAHTLSLTSSLQKHERRRLEGQPAELSFAALTDRCSEVVFVTAEQAETRNAMESWLIRPFAGEILDFLAVAEKGVGLMDLITDTPKAECYQDCWVLHEQGENLHAPIRVSTPTDPANCGIGTGLPATAEALVDSVVGALARKDPEGIKRLSLDPAEGPKLCPSSAEDVVEELRENQSMLEQGFSRVAALDWVHASSAGSVSSDLKVNRHCSGGLPWGTVVASYHDPTGMLRYKLVLNAYEEAGAFGLAWIDDFRVFYSDEAVASFRRIADRAYGIRFRSRTRRARVSLSSSMQFGRSGTRQADFNCKALDEEWGCSFNGTMLLNGQPAGTFLVFYKLVPGVGWRYHKTVTGAVEERESRLLREVGKELRKLQDG